MGTGREAAAAAASAAPGLALERTPPNKDGNCLADAEEVLHKGSAADSLVLWRVKELVFGGFVKSCEEMESSWCCDLGTERCELDTGDDGGEDESVSLRISSRVR